MLFIKQIFQKYSGRLRAFKASYVLNNILNYRKLKKNEALYRKMGLHKSVVAPVSSRDFANMLQTEKPWLDEAGAVNTLKSHPRFSTFKPALQQQLLQWPEKGYLVLEKFFDEPLIEQLNLEIDALLQNGQVDFNFTGRKIFDAFRQSATAAQVFRNPELIDLLSFMLGKQVQPFQSLNFIEGSEQKAHSDFIHMTTEPKGYLIAAWIALEDISMNNGPLLYYPGSQHLPYVLSGDYESGNTRWTIGPDNYKNYEQKIAALIHEKGLKKEVFLARKGDVLIWHANLLHGGSPIIDKSSTRKSMVIHYFAEGVFCYHELTERPAVIA